MRSRPVYCGRRWAGTRRMRALMIRNSSRSIATSDSSWWILASGASPFSDQRFAACEHRDPHDADHIEYCAADERVPVPGKASFQKTRRG